MAIKAQIVTGFHSSGLARHTQALSLVPDEAFQFTYSFQNFFHPFVGNLVRQLNRESLRGLFDAKAHAGWEDPFFWNAFEDPSDPFVRIDSFPKCIDVERNGPYANYNWELLFHMPFAVAVHLSKNQRFAEAQRWFHFLFDPTANDDTIPTPERFWRFLGLRNITETNPIDEELALLSKEELEAGEPERRDSVLDGYNQIRKNPFQPHAVARSRPTVYLYAVVMRYLDNLIAWGDQLFRQDTIESLNEATQRYVLAANILGTRPQRIPRMGTSGTRSFKDLKDRGLDPLGNALVELEGMFPFNLVSTGVEEEDPEPGNVLFGIGSTLYFCIPHNEKLLSYWETVADRLFKIRHCMNIEGVVRSLALFDPPLDPGMLVKAAAAGLDIGAVLSGTNQPVGPVRARILVQKALELSAEVKAMGATLLSAIEKQDAEHLSRVRQGHEIKIQSMARDIRFLQWQQARSSTESLLRGRASALERFNFFQRLLGREPDSDLAPDELPLDRRELNEDNFDEAYEALAGQYEREMDTDDLPTLRLAEQSSPGSQAGATDVGPLFLTLNEDAELNKHPPTARSFRIAAAASDGVFGVLALLPLFQLDAKYWGIGTSMQLAGGPIFSGAGRIISTALNTKASHEESMGQTASKTGSFERRADQWRHERNLAALELRSIGRQIITSLISEQVSYHEYVSLKKQIDHAEEVDRLLREKFTNEELYGWMQGEVSRLFYEYYRLAFDVARKAEQTMKQEIQRSELEDKTFVQFNYWDGGRRGLLSGEALHLDLKKLDLAYHEHNRREYELTRHVSLRRTNPAALLALKAAGECEFDLGEWVFDLDTPGHFMRRIKSVGLSVPAVTGPYASLNCTMTLLKSTVRKSPSLLDGEYARQGGEDGRFSDYFGASDSIVTSTSTNDSGMFEVNLRDERFLPFEGAGAISTWRLELPEVFRQFDYDTISDVILHIRYTARSGGKNLRDKAVQHVVDQVEAASTSGLALLLSLRHDLTTEWSRFVSGDQDFSFSLDRTVFPYFTEEGDKELSKATLFRIEDGALKSKVINGIDFGPLNEDGEVKINIPHDGSVLVREKEAEVFLALEYFLG